jgi:hypothetical protein
MFSLEVGAIFVINTEGRCIHGIGAPVEIVTFLLATVVLPIWWGLCHILRGLRP